MPPRRRLDAELVRRGLATTRTEAQRVIAAGGVIVSGRPSARAATLVSAAEPIEVVAGDEWASRAGGKLAAALERFAIDGDGGAALDVGASTGGFTDVLLDAGCRSVVAVDVGYGQLLWRLSTDPRVTVVDRTNFRHADPVALGAPFDIVVVDVSFISVGLLAANLCASGRSGTDYVVLVKPQFEVGREAVGRGGIVTDPTAHRRAITVVATALAAVDVAPLDVMASPVVGTHGNQEFLLWARHGATGVPIDELEVGA